MLRSLPTLTAALTNLEGGNPSSKKDGKRKKSTKLQSRLILEAQEMEEDDEDEGVDEMQVFQSQIEQSVVRASKALKEIDNVHMHAQPSPPTLAPSSSGGSGSGGRKKKSNMLQFIDDQSERLKTSIPLEYYTRQLNHKRVFRQIVEVDERVDFSARTWRSAMTDFGLGTDPALALAIGSESTEPTPRATQKSLIESASRKKKEEENEEEEDGYNSDEMNRRLKQMQAFSATRGDEHGAKDRLSVFQAKARRHLLRALEMERRLTDSQVLSLNQSIHSLDQQVVGLRKQLDAVEAALKERANTERMIKQVVEVRYSFSLQTLHDRIEEQNEKISKQSDSLALSQGYNTKVREIYHELARKGRSADPFVKKRAANLLKGLLKLLDEKESAIQKSREEAIRLAFEKISSNYRQGRVIEKEEDEMARLLEEITQDMTSYESALVVEKEEYKVKVRALREILEETDIKLVKNETILAEHARAERRQAHLANKRLSASTRRPSSLAAAETEVKVLSNEEYIQKMADHFMLMTGGNSGTGASAGVAIGSRAKKRRPSEMKDSSSSSSGSSSSSENDIEGDGGEVRSSKKNKKREHLPPLCDQETESLLHLTVNEEERRSLTTQSLQPMVVIHPTENYRETREEAAASRRGSVKLLSVDSNNNSGGTGGGSGAALPTTFTMISDSDSDSSSSSSSSTSSQIISLPQKKVEKQPKSALRVTAPSPRAPPGEQEGHKEEIKSPSKPTVQFADLSERIAEEQNLSAVTLAEAMKEPAGSTISSSATAGNRRNVQSEMATACYVKVYEEHLLKNPHHNFRRTAPRLQTLTLQGAEGGRRGSSKNNSNPSTSPTNPRKNSLNATAWLTDNQFQFTVTECSRVVLEIVSKLKACSCIDLVDTIHIVKTLNEVVKVYQSLSEDPNQLMALKYKLHYISIQLIQLICTKAPKILLVANKKAVLIDILQLLLAIVAVVINCTIPNWQIGEPLGIIADPYQENAFTHVFVEGLNQQIVFMLLGGYDELSKDNVGSSPVGHNKIIRRGSQYSSSVNEVKPNVRRFSQQLLHYSQASSQQNSLRHDDNDPGSTGGEGRTGDDLSPTATIQSLIALLKRQFKGVPLPEIIHGYFLVIDEEISGYLKAIAGRQRQQRDQGLPPSSAYDIEHYLSLYLIELFLFATFNQKLMRIEKFHQNVEKIKNHGYNINQSKSSYILELPVINVFHFDEFYMRIRYPEIVPAILSVNLLKSVVYQDVSKRLLLLNIHGTNNPETRRGSTLTSEGTDANGMSRLPDLQYLSVSMPIEAEIEMRSLSRKEGVGGTRSTSATSTGVRGANNSKKGKEAEVKSYATTYLMQKYQIGTTSTTTESSAIEISQTSIPTASKIALSGEDAEEDMKLENVLAIPDGKLDAHSRSLSLSGSMSQSGSQIRLSTGRNTAYLTAEERQTLPKTVYEVHEKWIADMRNYLHYLSKQIYKLLWSGVQHPGNSPTMAAKKRSLYKNSQSVLLPERLIYRVLSHIDNIHKIINTFSEDGEDKIYQLENEYQNCIMQLMLAQRKIYNIIYTITWPLRKKLIYLQNRYSSVLAENVNKINTIKELTKSNQQMKTNIEDLQRSLNILKYEKGVETFVERRGNAPDAPKGGWKQISLMQHSQNVQKLIVDYLKTETTNKATQYKQKVEILTSMLYKFRTEYDDLRIQTVGLLNSNHALYKTLPAQFMRDELIQDIYDINYSMGGLFAGVNDLDDNSLSIGQGEDVVGGPNQFLPLRGKKKKMMKLKRRQAGNLTEVPSDLTDSVVTDYLTNHRLQAILDKFNKHASQAMIGGEEDGLTNAIPMYDDMSMYGPDEVVEALRRQQQFVPDDYEAMRKLKAKYRRDQFQTLPIKLFAFGKRIELGLQSQNAMKEDLQKFLKESEERQRQDRSFLLSLGGEGFQGHKGQEPDGSDPNNPLLSLRGAKVKIALPTNANKTKAFIMSQLPTTPIYVLEKQRRLYEPTPLNLAKLMDIQHLLMARKQQLDAENQGENVTIMDDRPAVVQFDDELSVASASIVGDSIHDNEQPLGTDLPVLSPVPSVPPPLEGNDAVSSRISSRRTTRLRHSHIRSKPTKVDSAPPYAVLPVHSANIRPRKSKLNIPMNIVKDVKVDGTVEEGEGEQAEILTVEDNDDHDDTKDGKEDNEMLVMRDSIDSADLPPIIEKQNLQHDQNGQASSAMLEGERDEQDDQPAGNNQTDQLLLMEDPTSHAMRDLSRLEANLNKEVKHLIANLHTFRQALKTSRPSPTFYQIAFGRQRKFAGFILGDKGANRKAIGEIDRKVFNPITWPVFADDWHLQLLRKFEQEDAEKEAHDAQLFNDISLEDKKEDEGGAAVTHTISSKQQSIKKADITSRNVSRRTSKDGGLSIEALSSILSFQRGQSFTSSFRQAMSVSASHSHSKEESDSTTDQKAAPPKDQRPTSSFTSPRTKRMMTNS
eukprot:scaffold2924_cov165-Ochromonas_danica.AAC.10